MAVSREFRAEDRILRSGGLFLAAGYLIFFLILVPRILGQADRFAPWWTPFAAVATFVPAWLLAAAARYGSRRLIEWTAATAGAGYLLSLLTWWPASGTTHEPWVNGFWMTGIPGLPSLAVALVFRPAVAVVYVIVVTVGAQVADYRWANDLPLVPLMASAVLYCLICTAACLMGIRTSRLLDETRTSERSAAAAASARQAQAAERTRFDAIVHDWVLSTFLSAARTPDDPAVSRQARHALAQLERLRGDAVPPAAFTPEDVVEHLRSVIVTVDPASAAQVEVEGVDPGARWTYPPDAVRAVGAAVGEALRNSVRHAGPLARRTVAVRMSAGALRVRVVDDGVGFDIDAVSRQRLGIALAIRRQLETVVGGSASVDSAPGRGTSVTLIWELP